MSEWVRGSRDPEGGHAGCELTPNSELSFRVSFEGIWNENRGSCALRNLFGRNVHPHRPTLEEKPSFSMPSWQGVNLRVSEPENLTHPSASGPHSLPILSTTPELILLWILKRAWKRYPCMSFPNSPLESQEKREKGWLWFHNAMMKREDYAEVVCGVGGWAWRPTCAPISGKPLFLSDDCLHEQTR